ncbi:FGGY-family carbohydrate kinase [Luteococcus peritonei]|uniref:Ribulokinase n=1 Tax=Luteococcus peritonei TaxID=88874 RepID=A0ABW4RYR4_9ACTN
MSTEYLLGIDMGTGSARAGIFDATGKQYGFGSGEWATTHPHSGWAEQDPEAWWAAIVAAVQDAVKLSGVDPQAIKAVSMDATSSTVVFLDDQDRTVRPALLWMDVRAVEEADQIRATGDAALKYCGEGPVSAEWGLPKAMWVKKHEPEVFERVAIICDETDWLVNKLSGEWTMSVAHAAGKYFYDGDAGGWPTSLYRAVDAMDILERYPSHVAQVCEVVGQILPQVAEELGLSPSTLVVEGGIDAYVGAVGLGVAEPGKLALITGSSHVITGQLASPLYSRGLWGSFTDATVPGYYTIDGGQTSTGSIIDWFRRNLAAQSQAKAVQTGRNVLDILTEEAAKIPIGSDGLVMLDHFQGNRAPYFDGRSRGIFWGMTLAHTEAHLFRAAMEGICFGTENIVQIMREQQVPLDAMVVSGGATRNRLWLQMHADVHNLPLMLPAVTEGPVLGSAMMAAVGAGLHHDLPTASREMTRTAEVIEPDAEAHEQYRFNFEAYRDTYPAMQELMTRMTRHQTRA